MGSGERPAPRSTPPLRLLAPPGPAGLAAGDDPPLAGHDAPALPGDLLPGRLLPGDLLLLGRLGGRLLAGLLLGPARLAGRAGRGGRRRAAPAAGRLEDV